MIEDDIEKHLKQFNCDIRKDGNARFMDQKVTPDVLCIVSDCILQFVDKDKGRTFTTKDIWESSYAEKNVQCIFNKPGVLDRRAKSEYDKFFAQPLKMLSYSKVLSEEKEGKKNIYTIEQYDLLKYIAIRERNSLNFIVKYLEKVLRDSNVWFWFEKFFNNNNKTEFNSLKSSYEQFIISETPINGQTEARRIFSKVINPFCYIRSLHGTSRGHFSPDVIGYDELMYNRKNWRDVSKKKEETRSKYEERRRELERKRDAFGKFSEAKAKRLVKERHYPSSEVKDTYSHGNATQVHHIFPKSDFPTIDSHLENLILLTPNQHSLKAHPDNNTRQIDLNYQKICLKSKLTSIKMSVEDLKDGFYSKEDFIFVLNEGLRAQEAFKEDMSFEQVKEKICSEFSHQ